MSRKENSKSRFEWTITNQRGKRGLIALIMILVLLVSTLLLSYIALGANRNLSSISLENQAGGNSATIQVTNYVDLTRTLTVYNVSASVRIVTITETNTLFVTGTNYVNKTSDTTVTATTTNTTTLTVTTTQVTLRSGMR